MADPAPKETHVVTCDYCEARVSATVEGSYERYWDPPGHTSKVSLLSCVECNSPILIAQDDEDAFAADSEDGIERWGRTKRLYPELSRRQLGPAVPEAIRKAFSEAQACYTEAKAYTACAIMCRKVLEGICESYDAKGGTLAARLANLATRGELDHRLYQWITTLRVIGNEAAHDVGVTVSRDDATDLLDLADAVAEYLYTFKEKFEAFERRHGTPVVLSDRS